MSKVIYHASLSIVIWKKEEPPDSLGFEVDFFEVDGGVNRKIEIGTTDEFNIGSEFYEARTYKNIILYIRADSESHKLIELFKSGKKDFSIFFQLLFGAMGILYDRCRYDLSPRTLRKSLYPSEKRRLCSRQR